MLVQELQEKIQGRAGFVIGSFKESASDSTSAIYSWYEADNREEDIAIKFEIFMNLREPEKPDAPIPEREVLNFCIRYLH